MEVGLPVRPVTTLGYRGIRTLRSMAAPRGRGPQGGRIMSTYSVFHYAVEHDLEPWRLLFEIEDALEYGIGPAIIEDPEGNHHHDEYHPLVDIEAAARRLRWDRMIYTENRKRGILTVSVEDAWKHEDSGMLEVPVFYHATNGVHASAVWIGMNEDPSAAVTEAEFWAKNLERGMA